MKRNLIDKRTPDEGVSGFESAAAILSTVAEIHGRPDDEYPDVSLVPDWWGFHAPHTPPERNECHSVITKPNNETMKLSNQIKKDIDNSLRLFGEYSMTDKGADEVMDVDQWGALLREQSIAEARQTLYDVLEHPFGHHFVRAFLGDIDDDEGEWTEAIFADDKISEHY